MKDRKGTHLAPRSPSAPRVVSPRNKVNVDLPLSRLTVQGRLGNPLVRMLLRSPLHRVLDGSFLVLHLTGRKTGRRYNIPVGYVDMDGRFVMVTVARWRVNLRAARRTGAHGAGTARRGPEVRLVGHHPHPAVT